MNGNVICGTPIAVDYFRFSSKCSGSNCGKPIQFVYFLTHAHTDHTVGLTATWRSGPVYMSAVTADIIHHERKVARKWLRVLEIGESRVIQLKKSFKNFVVTPIDARHCAGSVMFLFQGEFGNILYTGDFRYCDRMMLDNDAFLQCSTIHRLYLDNTYCEPRCEFDTRQVATDDIIKLIAEDPDRRVFIGITKLGKEDLLIRLARHFAVNIVVDEDTYDFLQVLGNIPNVFSVNPDASRIHAVMATKLRCFDGAHHADDLLIIPTAHYVGTDRAFVRNGVRYVAYSNHSTFKELLAFVADVEPRQIIPIVNHDSKMARRSDMSVFDHLLDTPSNEESPEKLMSLLGTETPQSSMASSVSEHEYVRRRLSSSRAATRKAVVPSRGVEFDSSSESSDESASNVVHFKNTSSEGSPMTFVLSKDAFTTAEVPEVGANINASAVQSPAMGAEFTDSHSVTDVFEMSSAEDAPLVASFLEETPEVMKTVEIVSTKSADEVVAHVETTSSVDVTVAEGSEIVVAAAAAAAAAVSDSGHEPNAANLTLAPYSKRRKKDVRAEWEELAKWFHKKRLANPLFLSGNERC